MCTREDRYPGSISGLNLRPLEITEQKFPALFNMIATMQ